MPVTSSDKAASSPPIRPGLALRVGITGTREIPAGQLDALRRQVADVLDFVRQDITCLARMTETRQAYRLGPDKTIVPELRFVSPLAEGADRLAARIALEHSYTLHVPMPFHRCEYAKDFDHDYQGAGWDCGDEPLPPAPPIDHSSRTDFQDLLAHATTTFELDGGRDDPAHDRYDEARSYEAVGRFVARNCDLLIALWDGRPGKGRGGTADTVQFAADSGPPVWWIRTDRPAAPVWINDAVDLRNAAGGCKAKCKATDPLQAEKALQAYLTQLIKPPQHAPEPASSWLEWAARIGLKPTEPLAAFYSERPRPRRRRYRAFHCLIKWASGGYGQSWQDPPSPKDFPSAMFWHDAYQVPNKRAAEYADRYRSTYVWVFGLAAIALACAALALSVPGLKEHWFPSAECAWHAVKIFWTAAEFLALLCILGFVFINIRYEWHPRSIDYRLLAELYRKQQALALLGWSLSGRAVQALVEQHAAGEPPDRGAWVIWLFAAMSRAAPMPNDVFDPVRCEAVRTIIQRDLVEEQAHYHCGRLEVCKRAGHRFVLLGEALFLSIIVVVIKLTLLGFGTVPMLSPPLGIIATMVPGFAAAFIGVRAYAEMALLADQSRRMAIAMTQAGRRIGELEPRRPLASQELGVEVLAVTTRMLEDVTGWAQLSRMKPVEPG
jgi:hypothetical protein